MDLTALILIVVCACLLMVAYTLNSVKRTGNVQTILQELTKSRPDTRAVSLGYDRTKQKFRNAVLDQQGNVVIRYDPYPVTEAGEYIVLQEHGRVNYKDDHYTIDGFPFTKFTCPDGFVGKNCDPVPLCDESDENVYRPLTYRQFNRLRLYDSSIGPTRQQRRRRRRDLENIHDRIKIHCIANGKYELETCNNNELLDSNLECRPYDVCEDRLAGTKHNYPIKTDDVLEPNEYYTCSNNRSVRTKCSGSDMVFSPVYGTCIVKNQCVGMGDATIRIDDHRYVQCKDDTGRTVTCTNGIQEDETTGRLSCITILCKPYDLKYEDNVFRYVYGRVTCQDDRPVEQICEVEPYREHTYSYKWAQPFQLKIGNIPSNVYVDGSCKPLTNFHDIVHNPVVQLAWSDAMSQPYPFDFVKQEYICDTKYRWDYVKGVTVPSTNDFVDPGAPCQDRSYTTFELPWQNFETVRYPETGPPVLIGTPTTYVHETDTDSHWPVYLGNNQYQVSLFDIQPDKGRIVLTDWIDNVPPLGFIKSNDPQRNSLGQDKLDLLGFGQPPESKKHRWFVIASGRFAPIQVSKTAVQRRETIFEYDGREIDPTKQDYDKWYNYPIFWEKLDTNGKEFVANERITISRTDGVKIPSHTALPPGLHPLSFRMQDPTNPVCKINYNDFSIVDEAKNISKLVLP